MDRTPKALPPAVAWVLTHRLPCALAATTMFSLAFWFTGTVLALPLLLLHLLTPALFALITLGGGTMFSAQVACLTAVLTTLASHMAVQDGIILLLLYGLLPILAAAVLRGPEGISRSAQHLAIAIGMGMLGTLIAGAASQGMDAKSFVDAMLSPLFALIRQQQSDPESFQRLHNLTLWIFPGLSALSLLLIWWGNVLLARTLAFRYGFYHGDMKPVRSLRLNHGLAYLFLVLATLGLFGTGNLRYLAINATFLCAGLLAAQGLAVVHTWFWCRQIHLMAGLMYLALLIQPAMGLPFAVLGLLDIWFDFRRGMRPADGGK